MTAKIIKFREKFKERFNGKKDRKVEDKVTAYESYATFNKHDYQQKIAICCFLLAIGFCNLFNFLVTSEGLSISNLHPQDISVFAPFFVIESKFLIYGLGFCLQLFVFFFHISISRYKMSPLLWLIVCPIAMAFTTVAVYFSIYCFALSTKGNILQNTNLQKLSDYMKIVATAHDQMTKNYVNYLNWIRTEVYYENEGLRTQNRGCGTECSKLNSIASDIGCNFSLLGTAEIPAPVIEDLKKRNEYAIINKNKLNIQLIPEKHLFLPKAIQVTSINCQEAIKQLKIFIIATQQKLALYDQFLSYLKGIEKDKNIQSGIETINIQQITQRIHNIAEDIKNDEQFSKESLVRAYVNDQLVKIFNWKDFNWIFILSILMALIPDALAISFAIMLMLYKRSRVKELKEAIKEVKEEKAVKRELFKIKFADEVSDFGHGMTFGLFRRFKKAT